MKFVISFWTKTDSIYKFLRLIMYVFMILNLDGIEKGTIKGVIYKEQKVGPQ